MFNSDGCKPFPIWSNKHVPAFVSINFDPLKGDNKQILYVIDGRVQIGYINCYKINDFWRKRVISLEFL